MKKRLSFSVLATIAVCAVFAARALAHEQTGVNGWYWQNPKPQGNALYNAVFVDAEKGWMVGGAGTILRTTNGGDDWQVVYSGTDSGLQDVDFVNELQGWAVGADRTILHTSDGGAHWNPQSANSGPITTLFSIDMVSETEGWAAGLDYGGLIGVLLHTTDGGAHWYNVVPGTYGTLYDVKFTSADEGWVVGYAGRMLHTTNGGGDWTNVDSQTTEVLRNIGFADANEGWAMGQEGTIVHTSDGGATWAPQTSGTTHHLYGFASLSTTEVVAAVPFGLLRTTDGGATWNEESIAGGSDHYGVFFVGARGWVFGDGGAILRSDDGGGAWSPQVPFDQDPIVGISAVDSRTAWSVDWHTIMQTTDAGASWNSQEESSTWDLNDIQMLDANTGYVVGSDGLILKTVDGGTTWVPQSSTATQTLTAVFASSDTTAWACGLEGAIVRTADGSNWQTEQQDPAIEFYDIYFVGDEGWAVGRLVATDDSVIYHSSDGGDNWSLQTTPSGGYPLFSVEFLDENEGWAVGAGGQILHTTSGGAIWNNEISLAWWDLKVIRFIGPLEGWALGEYGTVLHTSDGGSDWQTELIGTENHLDDMDFIDSDTIWAVGSRNTVLSNFDPDWETAPAKIQAFSTVPWDESVQASWENPRDVHYEKTRLLRSDTRFANAATDTVGQSQVFEGTATAFNDTGLANGTVYYYTIFAQNEAGVWSTPTTATCTPFEPPPGPVTGFDADAWDEQVTLSWNNPSDPDYAGTRILRSDVRYATSPTDTAGQTQVFEGTATAFVDTGLTNYVTYYYTAYAVDDAGVWSVCTTVSATPFDPPPPPVAAFSATSGDTTAGLSWTNPPDADYDFTRILRSVSRYATGPDDTAGQTVVYEGTSTAFADGGLMNGRNYYYSAYARDVAGHWSSRATTSARPRGITANVISSDSTLVSYGQSVLISGSLGNAGGPIRAKTGVTLWKSVNGGLTWTRVGTAYYDWVADCYKASAILSANSLLQMQFVGDIADGPCVSNAVLVQCRAYFGKPIAPASVRMNAYFATYGLLLTPHGGTTKLCYYFYTRGIGWGLYSTRQATHTGSSFYTKYSYRYKLPKRGRWYVRGYHLDSDHAETWSAARYITVR